MSFSGKFGKLVRKTENLSTGLTESLGLGLKFLKFESESQEIKFQEYQSKYVRVQLKLIICLITFLSLAFFVLQYTHTIESIKYKAYSIIPALISAIFVFVIFQKKINYPVLVFFLGLFILSLLIVYSIINSSKSLLSFMAVEVLLTISFHFKLKITLLLTLLYYLASVFITLFFIFFPGSNGNYLKSIEYIFISFFNCCLLLSISYLIDLSKRQEYIFTERSKKKFKKSSQILSYLLPNFVKKRVNDGVRYIAEEKGVVSVIFCDICDFDKIMEDYSQSELITLLDDLFSKFDKICESFGVSKIETVGKTYLACAGLKDFDSDLNSSINEICHARRAIEMAFAILQETSMIMLKSGEYLKMKMGIHSGPVVAGVVGFHKPQFSLVGDTVNTASRMASTLQEFDKVQISIETFNLLENKTEGYQFVASFPEVKGKGKMKTFIVEVYYCSVDCGGSGNLSGSLSVLQSGNTGRNVIASDRQVKNEDEAEEISLITYLKNDSISWAEKLISIFFIESQADQELQDLFKKHTLLLQSCGLIISFLNNFVSIFFRCAYFSTSFNDSLAIELAVFIVEQILICLFLIYLKYKKNPQNLFFPIQTMVIVEIIIFFILDYYYRIDFDFSIYLFFLRFIQLNFCTSFLFFRNILSNLIVVIILILKLSLLSKPFDIYLYSGFFIVCTLTNTYNRELKLREDYSLREKYKKENEKTNQLLTNMLPAQALSNLHKELNVVDNLSQVTIMYADIVGFTQWSSTRSPNEVISMLSEMFTRFDKMCLKYDIFKVYTIGDCYVAMTYTGSIRRNPAKEAIQMIEFAMSLVDLISEVNVRIGSTLNMRIGIHTGNIMGSITGTNIVRYDIYGKDVFIANKMESHGIPGYINISQATKDLIEDSEELNFKFNPFKQIKAWDNIINSFIVGKN